MNSNKNNGSFIKKQIKRLMIGICKIVYLYIPIRWLNRFLKDKRSTLYAYWVRNSFKSCPTSVRFGKIGMLHDPEYISIGEKCFFQDYLYLLRGMNIKASILLRNLQLEIMAASGLSTISLVSINTNW